MTSLAQTSQRLHWSAPGNSPEPTAAWQKSLRPDGTERILAVDNGSEGLQLPAGKVRWARVLPASELSNLKGAVQLIGDPDAAPPVIEEVSGVKNDSVLLPVPAGVDVKDHLDWRAFGVEERVSTEGDPASRVWVIKAGQKPAGIFSERPWRLPKQPTKAKWELVMVLKGEGEVDIGIGTKRRAEFTDPPSLQHVRLSAGGVTVRQETAFDPGAEVRLSIASLGKPARLEIASVTWRIAKSKTSTSSLARGVWNWSTNPTEWRELMPLWKDANISVLQLAMPKELSEETTRTLKELRDAKFRVLAVEGDPHMVLPDARGAVLERHRQLSAGKGSWLDEVQYDVEPYLLPGFQLEPERWYQQWTSLFEAISRQGGVPWQPVVPYWLLNRDQGRDFLRSVAKSASRVAVMNYRADPVEALAWATCWLEWSVEQRCPVSIAVESGPIPDVKSVVFQEVESGPLWIGEWKGEGVAVVLFESDVRREGNARTFTVARQSVVPGARTTLKGRPQDLATIAQAFDGVVAGIPALEKLRPTFLIHEPTPEDLRALPH